MVSAIASSVSLRSGTALSAPRPVARRSNVRVMPVRALSDTSLIISGVQHQPVAAWPMNIAVHSESHGCTDFLCRVAIINLSILCNIRSRIRMTIMQ